MIDARVVEGMPHPRIYRENPEEGAMDEGSTLIVAQVGLPVILATSSTRYAYQGVTAPNHTCKKPGPLQRRDVMVIGNRTETSVLVSRMMFVDGENLTRQAQEASQGRNTGSNPVGATTGAPGRPGEAPLRYRPL